MWCVGKLTPEYVERMEDVLNLYEKPLDKKEPVVCLDEKSIQLRKDAREPVTASQPGMILKRDSEYVRKGTANVFCAVEPKAGKHLTEVTKNRKGPEYAKMIGKIAKAYPKATTIHLVMDNLNTHCSAKPLKDFYGEHRGQKLWDKFPVHHTPKHASWLNQAEIEIGVFSRQCLGRERVVSVESLGVRTQAWNQRVNREKRTIGWGFKVRDARKKMGYGVRRCVRAERSSPAAFGLRLRRSSVTGARPAPSSLLGSLQNRPATTRIMARWEH